MKYIISPLKIELVHDIDLLAQDILKYNGLNIIVGKAKVGKTALVYKFLHWWLIQESVKPPYLFPLGEKAMYQYWDEQLCQLYIPESTFTRFESITRIILSAKKGNIPKGAVRLILIALLSLQLNNLERNLIILDDMDNLHKHSNTVDIRLILMRLSRMIKENHITVLITCRSKKSIKRIIDALDMEEQGKFQYRFLELERPEYMGGDITEFGQTRVWVEE